MRTTLDIEDPLLKELRAMGKQEGVTLGALVSRLLTQALAGRRSRRPTKLGWKSQAMRPLLDISDKEAVYAALDEREASERP